ncbi:putative quinol monooxygenase [Psychroflexus tropicus]|uniref:putative quinol monooxygenase n=1 Tax=Psychroflexus tropicus TaxID=197345 RepID=UPI00036F57B5|nr:antibiotic biosynthesis monooxygenase family protein [Psychroflexus tropicus]
MLIRIVKMKFEIKAVDAFLELFDENKEKIRGFEGCKHLELYRDQKDRTLFFTYSYWASESHLNSYRHSALFAEVWKATKKGFSHKPEAWSLDQLIELN